MIQYNRWGIENRVKEREFLQNKLGFNIDKFKCIDKRQVLRNCVVPELGEHIFNCRKKEEQSLLHEMGQKDE